MRVKRELAEVKTKRDKLKNAAAYFAKESLGTWMDNVFTEGLCRSEKCDEVWLKAYDKL